MPRLITHKFVAILRVQESNVPPHSSHPNGQSAVKSEYQMGVPCKKTQGFYWHRISVLFKYEFSRTFQPPTLLKRKIYYTSRDTPIGKNYVTPSLRGAQLVQADKPEQISHITQ